MLANNNVYQFLHCQNALEINNDSLWISSIDESIYLNKCCHVGQDSILRGDENYIRREENLSATSVSTTSSLCRYWRYLYGKVADKVLSYMWLLVGIQNIYINVQQHINEGKVNPHILCLKN